MLGSGDCAGGSSARTGGLGSGAGSTSFGAACSCDDTAGGFSGAGTTGISEPSGWISINSPTRAVPLGLPSITALVRCLGHGISFSVLNNFLFSTNNFLFGTKLLSPSFFFQILRVSAVPAG